MTCLWHENTDVSSQDLHQSHNWNLKEKHNYTIKRGIDITKSCLKWRTNRGKVNSVKDSDYEFKSALPGLK